MNTSPRRRITVAGVEVPDLVAPPPGRPLEYWPVLRVGIDNLHVVALADRWWAWWTHYVERRTVPCVLDLGRDCHDCQLATRRWSGWLPVITPGRAGVQLLHLTEGAVNECPELRDQGVDLFGVGFVLGRQPRTKHGKLVARVSDQKCRVPEGVRKPLHKIQAQVFGLWGLPFSVQEEPS